MKTERKNEHYLALQQAFDAPWPGPVGELVTLEKGNIHLQIYPHDGARITSLKALVLKYYANGSRSAELFSMAVSQWCRGQGDWGMRR